MSSNVIPFEFLPERLPRETIDGRQVVSSETLADFFGTTAKEIIRNLQETSRFVKGETHFEAIDSETGAKRYYWTEQSILLHAKLLETDKAWEVWDIYVERHFERRKQ